MNIAGSVDPVPSNILTHKLGYIVGDTSSLLLTLPPEVTEQYTDIAVKYLYITSASAKTYTVELKINSVFYKTIIIEPNVEDEYSFYFEDAGDKRIQFTVLETGATSTFDITLTPYTGNLPLIDATRADLMLYLNPKGKTNNDVDKNIWIDTKGGQLTAYLNGVSYSEMDGWCVDEDTGDTYLKLISGATLTMPDFKPFTIDHVGNDGMTIELDFEVDGITDMNA